MRYADSLRFLNSFLNLEQVYRPHSRLWNLKRMRELYRRFGHPEKGILTVVIGGTKGKGSTGYFLSEILRHSGLRVGFYHSPHLEEPRERIWINGRPVSRKDFTGGLLKIQRRLCHDSGFTYFEIMTLLASLLFKEKKVQAAVFEVGMGGRLDATHVLPAKLAILTPIHYDHEAFLGNTLSEIAHEKAAILPHRRDGVIAPQTPEALQEIRRTARRKHCTLWPPLHRKGVRIRLKGDFQKENAATAFRAAEILRARYRLPIKEGAFQRGVGANHWPGRMELFKGKPSLLLDGAHNPKSIAALSRNLKRLFPNRRKILIFGTSRDKRSERMFPLLSRVFDVCLLTQAENPRAKEAAALLKEARDHFPILLPVPSSKEALRLARKIAGPSDLIVATGSFYLIGEIRRQCRP